MAKLYDRIKVATSTTGTGSLVPGSAETGFRSFSTIPTSTRVNYAIEDGSDWEVGEGIYTNTPAPAVLVSGDAFPFTDAMGSTVSNTSCTQSTTTKQYGTGSVSFPGSSGNRLSFTSSIPTTTGSWTFECWYRPSSVIDAPYHTLFSWDTWHFSHQNTSFYAGSTPTTYNNFNQGAGILRNNAWNHVALVQNSTTNTLTCFVNGYKYPVTVAITPVTASQVRVGCASDNTQPVNGFMDDIKFTNTALYTNNFTIPTSAFSSSAVNTLTRTVSSSSNSDAALSLTGSAKVFVSALATNVNQPLGTVIGYSRPVYRANWMSGNGTSSSAAPTAGTARLLYFNYPGLSATNVAMGNASSSYGQSRNVRYAIYTSHPVTGAPYQLVEDSGSMSIADNNRGSDATPFAYTNQWNPSKPITFDAGPVWIGVVCDTSTVMDCGRAYSTDWQMVFGCNGSGGSPAIDTTTGYCEGPPYFETSLTFATGWPSSWPAGTSLGGGSATVARAPHIMIW